MKRKPLLVLIFILFLLSSITALYGCGKPTIDELITDLSSRDIPTKWDATDALVEIGAPAVEPLIVALNAGDSETRRSAAFCLGLIKDPRAVKPLITMLHEDENEDVRKSAQDALKEIGAPAVEPLFEILADGDEDIRALVFSALYEIGTPAVESLIVALENKPFPVQVSIASLLWEWRQKDSRAAVAAEQFYAHLKELCYGEHNLGVPVPGTVVLLDPSSTSNRYVIHPWTYELPAEWKSAPINNIEFIGIIHEEWVTLGKCVYTTGAQRVTVSRQQQKIEVRLMETRTGELVADTVFNGSLPDKFPYYWSSFRGATEGSLRGNEVSISEVLSWLRTYVMK
jgi:hypothetical protein